MSTLSQSGNATQVNGAPLTTTVTNSVGTLLSAEIDKRVTKIRPMATPVDQLSRCGDIRHAGSMKVQYYTADVKEVSTNISSDYTGSDYQALPNGDQSSGQLTLHVDNPAIFSVSETILMPEVTINKAPLMLYLTKVDVDSISGIVVNEIKNAGTTFNMGVKTGRKVIRMGRAAGELDVQTPQFETIPKRSENYCQIFKMQVEESAIHRLANKEAQWGFSDQEEVAIIDMRQGMEKNFIFGRKAIITNGTTPDEIYITGGIWNQDGLQEYKYEKESFTETNLIEICRKVFTGGKGSARKILMGGSEFIEMLSNLPYQKVVNGADSVTRWGLEFREIKSNFGTLYVIHNEIFDQCGHEKSAMVIDPNMLTKYVHIPFSTQKLDLRSAGTRNTDAVVITEASCLVLRNPACHMRIEAE